MRINLRAVVFVVMGIIICGACGDNPERPSSNASSAIEKKCKSFCFRLYECFWEICNEDYPRSLSTFDTTVEINRCIDVNCPDKYVELLKTTPNYIRCNEENSCRDIATGVCDPELTVECGIGSGRHPRLSTSDDQ
jgi:hypothetical protein